MRFPTDIAIAAAVTALLSAFTWAVLNPGIGFDDANITQNYARNIANGLGYVYYAGGERVEGSTSALWTALNVLGYLVTDTPETLFAAMGFAFTTGMVVFTILIARSLLRMAGLTGGYPALIVAALYALIPALFGWTVWSLMETGLWCFLVAGYLWAGVRFLEDRTTTGRQGPAWALVLFGVLMVLTRPEGIALVAGGALALMLLDRAVLGGRGARMPLLVIVLSVAAFGALTLARLWYFGVPHPNTYYAKVATDRMAEIAAGLNYTKTYLGKPEHIAIILLAALGLGALLRMPRTTPHIRGLVACALFSAAVILGTVAVYVMLGGDHFGSHRYYQIFLIVLIPAAVLGLTRTTRSRRRPLRLLALVCLAAMALQWTKFRSNGGHFISEFRLAEGARGLGTHLSGMSDRPGVATIMAGGIALTYDGPIYDMLGLNWVAMAHSDREARGIYGVFNKALFLDTSPQVVAIDLVSCDRVDWPENPFLAGILDNLFQDPEFHALYVLDCWNGMALYRLREYQVAPAS